VGMKGRKIASRAEERTSGGKTNCQAPTTCSESRSADRVFTKESSRKEKVVRRGGEATGQCLEEADFWLTGQKWGGGGASE